jgi:NAD(P)-dependent dehydrogenase (short-subunit alcohol dehydrogenase family)
MHALVTGASRGIGRAVTLELASRGHHVVATMRDPAAGVDLPTLAAELGGSIEVTRLDVTEPSTIQIPAGTSIVVSNAAVELANHAVEDTPMDDWRHLFETNVFGVVEVVRRAVPVMRGAGGGVLCLLGSAGAIVPTPFYGLYRASKAAISAMGESLRIEVAPHGIRVVEVLPGPIDTDMLAGSSVTPEAVSSPPYTAVAERMAVLRAGTFESATSVEEAAQRIVDAIEDPTSPHRVACDDLGQALLDDWRSQTDEESMQTYLAAFTADRPTSGDSIL